MQPDDADAIRTGLENSPHVRHERELARHKENLERRRADAARRAAEAIDERLQKLAAAPSETDASRKRQAHLAALQLRQERQRRALEWKRFLHVRGIAYADSTLQTFDCPRRSQREAVDLLRLYLEDFHAHFADGIGVTFYGPCGAGKDHLAVAICRAAILSHGKNSMWISGTKLFNGLKDRLDSRSPESIDSFRRRLERVELLCISDPIVAIDRTVRRREDGILESRHVYGVSPFEANALNEIADERCNQHRPTLLTINAADEDHARQMLTDQAIDRWAKKNIQLRCFWPSHRTANRPRLQEVQA